MEGRREAIIGLSAIVLFTVEVTVGVEVVDKPFCPEDTFTITQVNII